MVKHPVPTSTALLLSPASPNIQPRKQTLPLPTSPLPSPQMPRSETLPARVDAQIPKDGAKVSTGLKVETKALPEEKTGAEICLSPSWSDHGEKERRREKKRQEREQREDEKRRKQELEGRPQGGKRLSKKPPPAAMETQKMPAELRRPRRNSLIGFISSRESSRERDDTRRSSKEEKRMSGSSFTSFMTGRRSQSESRRPSIALDENADRSESEAETWNPKVSAKAPRLPSLRFSSRKQKNGKTVSWGAGEESENEFVAFAYQLHGPAVKKTSNDPGQERSRPKTVSTVKSKFEEASMSSDKSLPDTQHKQRPAASGTSKSMTEPILPTLKKPHQETMNTSRPMRQREISNKSQPAEAKLGSPEYHAKAGSTSSEEAAAELITLLKDQNEKQIQALPSPKSTSAPNRFSGDGSSYVHKQRMYQQQRSIAGFEEQQALQLFNEQAAIAALERENIEQLPKPADTSDENANARNLSRLSQSPSRNVQRPNSMTEDAPRGRTASPAKRASIQPRAQPQPSPLKTVSQAPANTIDKLQEQHTKTLKRASEQIPQLNPPQAQASKTDKLLGFRRRSRQSPTSPEMKGLPASLDKKEPPEIKEQHPALRPIPSESKPQEEAAPVKRSKLDRMSAQIPFRTRRDSASPPEESKPVPQPDVKAAGASKARPLSNSIMDVKSAMPKSSGPPDPRTVPSDKANDRAKREREQALAKARSAQNGVGQSGKQARPPVKSTHSSEDSSHSSVDSAILAAEYTEVLSPTSGLNDDDEPQTKSTAKVNRNSELVVQSVTGEGILRKTSITRPRSNPQLQTQSTVSNSLPSLDFLPKLKHQPLVKTTKSASAEQSPSPPMPAKIKVPAPVTPPSTAYKSPATSNPPDLSLMPRSPLRQPSRFPAPAFNRSATSVTTPGKGSMAGGLEVKPIAKLFVICCKCKFWHDLPSRLYEAMALPKELHRNADGSMSDVALEKVGSGGGQDRAKGAAARLDTAVKCPWCEHAMTTWCCAGWTTVVYMHERHH